jgi:hypothetical protein
MQGASDRIRSEVESWDGVAVRAHRFGGIEFTVGRRELGHLHGDRLADLPFPIRLRVQLEAEGRVERHHFMPDSGWASRQIRTAADIEDVIALLRLNYERANAGSVSSA